MYGRALRVLPPVSLAPYHKTSLLLGTIVIPSSTPAENLLPASRSYCTSCKKSALLRNCASCCIIRHCSVGCQRADLKRHKKEYRAHHEQKVSDEEKASTAKSVEKRSVAGEQQGEERRLRKSPMLWVTNRLLYWPKLGMG
ncbi:hypothetical protein BU16DRAFT_561202 [Lophium mytilinum]|uniref:MYND-type domain-containing protein n=1 Tax=Lophium mytilinum TaxID=390894 RepID=A0A6A6QXJ9_9PEZI|nr:hypothetical protein BU16DRAFT_561202 [Lophium mytilinum]